MEDFSCLRSLKYYYIIPDYQRDYEWTNTENNTLVDDIFDVARRHFYNKDAESHFIGAIVTIPYDPNTSTNIALDLPKFIKTKDIRQIVDGQQRITSLSVFVKALWDFIKADDDLKILDNTAHNYIHSVLFGEEINNETQDCIPRLTLSLNTGSCYMLDILQCKPSIQPKRQYKGPKRLLAAYTLFYDALSSKKKELYEEHQDMKLVEKYFNILIQVTTKELEFVEITCDKSTNAFQVFDSLNGKGLDLTAADRIKNIFLSWKPGSQTLQKWDSLESILTDENSHNEYIVNFFISLFFYKLAERIPKNTLPNKFSEIYKNEHENIEDFYLNLRNAAQLYRNLRFCKTDIPAVDELLEDFSDLKFEQVYVLIFSVAYHYHNLQDSDFYNFLETFISLIVRMQVGQQSMNKLDKMFSHYIKMMKNGEPLTNITNTIRNEIKLSVPDAQFKLQFKSFAPADRRVSEFYVRHLEIQMKKNLGVRNPYVPKHLTVEHIIPQTLDSLESWYKGNPLPPDEIRYNFKDFVVERLGNKTLLYGDDNSSASNQSYDIKLEVYKTGKRGQNNGHPIDTFAMIKDLVEKYPFFFGDQEVEKRSEQLSELALQIWK